MEKGIIYYKMLPKESKEEVINKIREIEFYIRPVQVFIDQHNDNRNLLELCDYPLDGVKSIYINERIENDFDYSLLMQVCKNSNSKVKYFSDLIK